MAEETVQNYRVLLGSEFAKPPGRRAAGPWRAVGRGPAVSKPFFVRHLLSSRHRATMDISAVNQ